VNYLKVGAKTKTIPLLRSRSNKFMISVAMKITIKSINGVYELHYEAHGMGSVSHLRLIIKSSSSFCIRYNR